MNPEELFTRLLFNEIFGDKGYEHQDGPETPQTTNFVEATVKVAADKNFAQALEAALDNAVITRAKWGKGCIVSSSNSIDNASTNRPYLYRKDHEFQQVPWLPSQEDLFATDWAILPG